MQMVTTALKDSPAIAVIRAKRVGTLIVGSPGPLVVLGVVKTSLGWSPATTEARAARVHMLVVALQLQCTTSSSMHWRVKRGWKDTGQYCSHEAAHQRELLRL